MNIYVTAKKDEFDNKQIKMIEKLGKVIYIESVFNLNDAPYLKDNDEKILAIDPDYYDWKISNEHIAKIKNLKAICVDTTTYSWIDTDYCKELGIIVTNVPRYSTTAVSEYAIFMMMAVARKLPLQFKNDFRRNYSSDYMMTNLKDKKVGVIGLGNIGTSIAELCNGLGMNVSYWSVKTRNDKFKYKELEQLFKESDFIFPAFLSNNETRQIITTELIKKMKKSASFISVVHNDLYNHTMLLEMVKNNELYGYAFEEDNSSMLKYRGNVFVTSSYAWYTKEAMDKLIEIWLESVLGVVNKKIINCVN